MREKAFANCPSLAETRIPSSEQEELLKKSLGESVPHNITITVDHLR